MGLIERFRDYILDLKERYCVSCGELFKNEPGSKRRDRSKYCSDRCRENHLELKQFLRKD